MCFNIHMQLSSYASDRIHTMAEVTAVAGEVLYAEIA